jgi:hypothetical protein
MKRRIACPNPDSDFSQKCLSIQLDYLHSQNCVDLKSRAPSINALHQTITATWEKKRDTYFDPQWLRTTQERTEQRSATFEIDPKVPSNAWRKAIANLEYNNPGDHWTNDKKAFEAILIVLNSDKTDSHAIGIRKSHEQHYFLHDIHTESKSEAAMNGCVCKEYKHTSKADFEGTLDAHLRQYTAYGFTQIFIIKFIEARPYGVFTKPLSFFFGSRKT